MIRFKKALRGIGILPFIIVVMCVFIQILNPIFFTMDTLSSLMRQFSILEIITLGMTLVIITGNIDLSMGSMVALSAVIGCDLMKKCGNSIAIGFIVALTVGAVAGMINGAIISKFDVHPFIITLGTQTAYRGLVLLYTGGPFIADIPTDFIAISSTDVFGVIPLLFLISVLVYVFFWILVYKTQFGRHLYCVGGNAEAAQATGIDIGRVKRIAYMLCGMTAALAGMLLVTRSVSADPSMADDYHSRAIGSAVLGGISLAGGKGRLHQTIYGVLITCILNTGLNMLKVSSYWQTVTIGLAIIVATVIDSADLSQFRKRRGA